MKKTLLALTLVSLFACSQDGPTAPTATPDNGAAVYALESFEARGDTCTYDTFGDQPTMKLICEINGGRFKAFKPTPNSISTGACTLPFPGVLHSQFKLRHPNRQPGCLTFELEDPRPL